MAAGCWEKECVLPILTRHPPQISPTFPPASLYRLQGYARDIITPPNKWGNSRRSTDQPLEPATPRLPSDGNLTAKPVSTGAACSPDKMAKVDMTMIHHRQQRITYMVLQYRLPSFFSSFSLLSPSSRFFHLFSLFSFSFFLSVHLFLTILIIVSHIPSSDYAIKNCG